MEQHQPVLGLTVIGVGNRDRGDDAIGPVVADRVSDRWPTMVVEGDLSDLALRWPLDDHVVVIDATVTTSPPGTVRVVDVDAIETVRTVSTHGIGLGDGITLARHLERLPVRLTVIGVEAHRFDELAPLSGPVAAAVDQVVQMLGELAAG